MNIEISNGSITAVINPKGAELASLKDADGKEYIWDGNPEYWGKHSPILFPIVGTLKNNAYNYHGQDYTLSRHGFARDNVFIVKHLTPETVTFSLSQNENTLPAYPFRFELELTYTIRGNTLELEYRVNNTGAEPMPFSLGAHPAFALPGNFNDYSLVFEKQEVPEITQLKDDLLSDVTTPLSLTDKTLVLDHDLFANDALIFKSLESNNITICHQDKSFLKVSFTDFPHLGLWTKSGAPFLCIEPWQGYSDSHHASGDILEKEGIILLSPAENYEAGFQIEILR